MHQTDFAIGQTLLHPKFGEGLVQDIVGQKVTVDFGVVGTKVILDSWLHAELTANNDNAPEPAPPYMHPASEARSSPLRPSSITAFLIKAMTGSSTTPRTCSRFANFTMTATNVSRRTARPSSTLGWTGTRCSPRGVPQSLGQRRFAERTAPNAHISTHQTMGVADGTTSKTAGPCHGVGGDIQEPATLSPARGTHWPGPAR